MGEVNVAEGGERYLLVGKLSDEAVTRCILRNEQDFHRQTGGVKFQMVKIVDKK